MALEAFRVGYPEMGMTYPSLKETFGMPKVVQGNAGEACEECQEVQVGNVNLCYHSPFTNHVGRIVNCPVCYAQGIDMVHVIVDCRGLDEFQEKSDVGPNCSLNKFIQDADSDTTSVEKARRVLNDGMTNPEDYRRRGRLMFDMRELWLKSWMELWLGEEALELLTVGRSFHRIH